MQIYKKYIINKNKNMLYLKNYWEIFDAPEEEEKKINNLIDQLINWGYASERTVLSTLQKYSNKNGVSFTFVGEDEEGEVVEEFKPEK